MKHFRADPKGVAPQHLEVWRQLGRTLGAAGGFRLLLLTFGDTSYRKRISRALRREVGEEALITIEIQPNETPRQLEDRLAKAETKGLPLEVTGFEHVLKDRTSWFERLNYARESLAERCPVPLLFWLHDADANAWALHAPDLWAWRTGVYEFTGKLDEADGLGLPAGTISALQSTVVGVNEFDLDYTLSTEVARERLGELERHLRFETNSNDSDHRSRAALQQEAGLICHRLGDKPRASEHFQQALASLLNALVSETPRVDAATAANLHEKLARLSRFLGDSPKEIDNYRKALELNQTIGRRDSCAYDLNKLGLAHGKRGDLDASYSHFQRALTINREIGNKTRAAQDLLNIGVVQKERGDLDSAIELFEEALSLNIELKHESRICDILRSLGTLYEEQGRIDDAITSYQKAITLAQEIAFYYVAAQTSLQLGNLHMVQQDVDAAIEVFQTIIWMSSEFDDIDIVADALNNLGATYMRQGNLDTAVDSFNRALTLYRELSADSDVKRVEFTLAKIQKSQQDSK